MLCMTEIDSVLQCICFYIGHNHVEPITSYHLCSLLIDAGRAPETKALGLDKVGVRINEQTGKIVVREDESTSVPNIYAFGDIGEVHETNPAEKSFYILLRFSHTHRHT